MNLSEISMRGNPTPDDLYEAAMLVEEVSVIAGILSVAQASETEWNSAMSGIARMLKISSNILAEGLDVNGGTFSQEKQRKKGAA